MGLAPIPHNNYGRKIEQGNRDCGFPRYERIQKQPEYGDEARFQRNMRAALRESSDWQKVPAQSSSAVQPQSSGQNPLERRVAHA